MYQLGSLILPNPKKLTRNIIETGVTNLTLSGQVTKKIQNRKEQYVLEYLYLTQAQISSILVLFGLEEVLSFTVSEANLSISPIDVLMDVSGLSYPPSGKLYLENIVITLTEVN